MAFPTRTQIERLQSVASASPRDHLHERYCDLRVRVGCRSGERVVGLGLDVTTDAAPRRVDLRGWSPVQPVQQGGGVGVAQQEGMAGDAQGGEGVAVPVPGLGGEDVALADQHGGDRRIFKAAEEQRTGFVSQEIPRQHGATRVRSLYP